MDEQDIDEKNVVQMNVEKEQDQVTKFKGEQELLLGWLSDYEQRTAQVSQLRERLAFLNGWLAAHSGDEVQ